MTTSQPWAGHLFRALTAHSPYGVLALGVDGACVYANARWHELSGLRPEQASGAGWRTALHPDDRAVVAQQVDRALQGEVPDTVMFRFVLQDGSVRWVEGVASPVEGTPGADAPRCVCTCLDVTAHRETEEALLRSSERFRVAFDNAPIGVALLRPDGRWFHVNQALCDLLGYTAEELYERTFADITHPDDLEANLERSRKQLEGDEWDMRIEKRYIRSDGEIVWVALSNSVVRDEHGEPLYFVAQIEDIGELKRVEQELQRLVAFDVLTALGNRRKLTADLARVFEPGEPEPQLLILFDLNGFKHYNDTFGHPAGDALLGRLAAKLAAAAAPHGEAYRLGGDEFCVLARLPEAGAEDILDATARALEETGDGFRISTSFGAILLPDDAADPSAALTLADQRLYAQKHQLNALRGQPHGILLRAIHEREPGLREHSDEVAELAVAVGARLGLGEDDLVELRLAAELHDVGKLAIPDAVLQKPGPLSDAEWTLMRQHTLIGQRILAAAPALLPIGEIVRCTHERWDGTGYVDGLAGEDIPLAARIIAACDAFVAMTTDRPYRNAFPRDEALAELERHAGAQFDPRVVPALRDEVRRVSSASRRAAAASRRATAA